MNVVLGISVRATDVTAALVDVELPQLGPVEERVTSLGSGQAVGDLVATAVGVMILLAKRNDLRVQLVTVAYETETQRNAIVRAFEAQHITGIGLVDASNPKLNPAYSTVVAAAVWGAEESVGPDESVKQGAPAPSKSSESTRRGLALVAGGIAAAVVAGGVAVWAVAGTRGPESTGTTTPLTSETSTVTPTSTVPVAPPILPPAPVAPPVTTDPDTGEVYSVDPDTGETFTPQTYTENPFTGETFTEETVPQGNVRTPSSAAVRTNSVAAPPSTRSSSRPNGGGSASTASPVPSQSTSAPEEPVVTDPPVVTVDPTVDPVVDPTVSG